MKKFLASMMVAGCIVTMGTAFCPNTVSANVVTETEIAETAISPRTSTFEVTGTGVRLRKSPGTSAAIVRVLKKGEYVNGGRQFEDKNGYTWTWVQCQSDGATGWVAIDYLNEIG